MQYLLLIQNNAISEIPGDEWGAFFEKARAGGMFQGGSALGSRVVVGAASAKSTAHIAGYMRFDATDRQQILDLLADHPVVRHGGSVELCEMPKS